MLDTPTWLFVLADMTSSATSPAPAPASGIKWSDIIGVLGLLVGLLATIFTYLINRRNSIEEQLRKSEQAKLDESAEALREHFDTVVAQLESGIEKVSKGLDGCADDTTVASVRQDLKALTEALDRLKDQHHTHQRDCLQRFVQRDAYSAESKAQADLLQLIRTMIEQQEDMVARLDRMDRQK